jgi:hypothetical protein
MNVGLPARALLFFIVASELPLDIQTSSAASRTTEYNLETRILALLTHKFVEVIRTT